MKVGDIVKRRGEVGIVRRFVEPKPGWHRAAVFWPYDDSRANEPDGWVGGSEQYVDVDALATIPVVVVATVEPWELISADVLWAVRHSGTGEIQPCSGEQAARLELERRTAPAVEPPPAEPTRQGSLF